jgi:uncharacterized membrane protein YccC
LHHEAIPIPPQPEANAMTVQAAPVPGWLAPVAFLVAPSRAAGLFAVTTTVAALCALGLGYWLQLDVPVWAAMTVLIVASPTPGNVAAKGVYRVIGTLTGVSMAVVLIGLFAETPELFFLALSLWLAACTFVAVLLKGFRSYGAVLSGYTTAIIALSSSAKPGLVFDVAVSRGSAILLGVVCGSIASLLLLRRASPQGLLASMRAVLASTAAAGIDSTKGETMAAIRRRIVQDLSQLDAQIIAALYEAPGLRAGLGHARGFAASVLEAISAGRAMSDHLRRLDPAMVAALRHDLEGEIEACRALLQQLIDWVGAGRDCASLPDKLRRLADCLSARIDEPQMGISHVILLDRLAGLLSALAAATESFTSFRGGKLVLQSPRLSGHFDVAQAARNALRAFIAVLAAGWFWMESAWPEGGGMVTILCVICTLFATMDRPSVGALGFLQGSLIAVPVAYVWSIYILPQCDGFAMLSLALAPPLLVGTLAIAGSANPGVATAFSIIFLQTVGPANVMRYDPARLLDGALASTVGIAIGALVYSIILPFNREGAIRRTMTLIRRDLLTLVTAPRPMERSRFETRLYDRLTRLVALGANERQVASSVASLGIGLETLQLRTQTVPPQIAPLVDQGIARLARLLRNRLRWRPIAADDETSIVLLHDGASDRPASRRVAAAFRLITDALDEHSEDLLGGPAA